MKRVSSLVLAISLCASAAAAEDPKREAKQRFDRAVQLADAGDLDRALAEFQRAYELIPNARVLSNIAEVQAALGRPVEATASLDKLLAEPGNMGAPELQAAKALRDREDAKVGTVEIQSNVSGARIEVDNVTAGTAPLTAPLRIGSGSHIVGLIAVGHAPQRKTVTLAGREGKSLKFDLVPLEARLAHLEIRTMLPGMQVLVDGQEVAKTPVPATLTFAPGTYHVEGRRDGYRTATSDVVLGEGATGSITLDPSLDESALSRSAGTLVVQSTEPGVSVIVDGRQAGTVTETRLPPGPHALRFEKAGFVSFERNVTLKESARTVVQPTLVPTPEARDAYVSHAKTTRTIGWSLVVAGAVVTIGSGIATAIFTGDLSDAQKGYDDQVAKSTAMPKGTCNDVCLAEFDAAHDKLDHAKTKQTIALSGTGVGVAALGTGIVLLLIGDDVHRYDRLEPVVGLGPNGAFAGLGGRF